MDRRGSARPNPNSDCPAAPQRVIEPRSWVRGWVTPVLAAPIAALAGFATCRRTFAVVMGSAESTQPLPHPTFTLVAPFLLGAVVTAITYLALRRFFDKVRGIEALRATGTSIAPGNHDPSTAAHTEPSSVRGPIAILLVFVAIPALIAAWIAGLLTKYDSGEMVVGAVLGAVLGLLIGIPAALLVWVGTRRRR